MSVDGKQGGRSDNGPCSGVQINFVDEGKGFSLNVETGGGAGRRYKFWNYFEIKKKRSFLL